MFIALTGLDSPVFFTSGAGCSATAIRLVNVGRCETVFTGAEEGCLFSAAGAGGWLVGRLEILFTTRGRSWAEMVLTMPNAHRATQSDRNKFFFKLFKTYETPGRYFSDEQNDGRVKAGHLNLKNGRCRGISSLARPKIRSNCLY